MEETATRLNLFKPTEWFDAEEVNRRRQLEVDIAKALAIIFMVFCHAYLALYADLGEGMNFFVDGIIGGAYAAPVFMFTMGMGFAYSRRNDAKSLFFRGLRIFILAYVLNFIRLNIPSFICFGITGGSEYLTSWARNLFVVDILQFAGLSMMIIAGFKKLKLNWWFLLGFAAILSIIGPFLIGKATPNAGFNLFLDLFYRADGNSYFPLFHWFLLPVVGLKAGELYLHLKDKTNFFLFILLFAFPASCVFEVIAYFMGVGLLSEFTGFYAFTLLSGVTLCGFVLGFLSLIGLILLPFKKPHVGFFCFLSRNVNAIYCIHWAILYFMHYLFPIYWPYEAMPLWQWLLFSLGVLLVSIGTAAVYASIKKAVLAKARKAA